MRTVVLRAAIFGVENRLSSLFISLIFKLLLTRHSGLEARMQSGGRGDELSYGNRL